MASTASIACSAVSNSPQRTRNRYRPGRRAWTISPVQTTDPGRRWTVRDRVAEGMGFEPMVTVSTRKYNDYVEIRVKDNGDGIPENVLDKIFQPFFTTKPTGQGTGLGLSMSYDIITKGHGGKLEAETKNGEGAAFIIQLPLEKTPA